MQQKRASTTGTCPRSGKRHKRGKKEEALLMIMVVLRWPGRATKGSKEYWQKMLQKSNSSHIRPAGSSDCLKSTSGGVQGPARKRTQAEDCEGVPTTRGGWERERAPRQAAWRVPPGLGGRTLDLGI